MGSMLCDGMNSGLVLPVAADVVPLGSELVPMVGDPVALAFGDPGTGRPAVEVSIPFPVAGCPCVAVAMRWLVFDAWGWGRDVAYDF